MKAARPATSGASTAGTATLATRPDQLTPLVPTAARAEPTTPPIRAWDDDEGMLRYQVSTFQMIAPSSPAKTIWSVTMPWSTMPFAIVAATLTERNAPTKFRVAATPTATRGGRARVAM